MKCVSVSALAVLLAACSPAAPHGPVPGRATSSPVSPSAPASASASARPSPSAPPPTSPAPTTRESLDVPGFPPAHVVVPPPSDRPKPLVVVTHGAGGRPEPHCDRYDEIVAGGAFILCTSGRPIGKNLPEEERGYFYDGHHELGREVVLAIQAARTRYGDRLDASGAIFAGYSQGASMGLLFLHEKKENAALFSRALLVEGGAADWNVALSARMREVGLSRVAIVCGQQSCKASADQSKVWMTRGGLDLRLAYAPGAGHTYGGAVAPHVEEAFAWLIEHDPRFLSAPKAAQRR